MPRTENFRLDVTTLPDVTRAAWSSVRNLLNEVRSGLAQLRHARRSSGLAVEAKTRELDAARGAFRERLRAGLRVVGAQLDHARRAIDEETGAADPNRLTDRRLARWRILRDHADALADVGQRLDALVEQAGHEDLEPVVRSLEALERELGPVLSGRRHPDAIIHRQEGAA